MSSPHWLARVRECRLTPLDLCRRQLSVAEDDEELQWNLAGGHADIRRRACQRGVNVRFVARPHGLTPLTVVSNQKTRGNPCLPPQSTPARRGSLNAGQNF